jgi:hypothetical protein
MRFIKTSSGEKERQMQAEVLIPRIASDYQINNESLALGITSQISGSNL